MKVLTHSRKSKQGQSLARKAAEKRKHRNKKLYKSNKDMGYKESRDAMHMRRLLIQ